MHQYTQCDHHRTQDPYEGGERVGSRQRPVAVSPASAQAFLTNIPVFRPTHADHLARQSPLYCS